MRVMAAGITSLGQGHLQHIDLAEADLGVAGNLLDMLLVVYEFLLALLVQSFVQQR